LHIHIPSRLPIPSRSRDGEGGLNKSQTRALPKLKEASDGEFQRLTAHAQRPPNSEMGYVSSDSSQINISDLSAREIEEIGDKAAKKEALIERNRPRRSPSLSLEAKIVLMNRLGIPVDRIAARLKVNLKTVLNYSHSPPLVQSIRELLGKGVSVPEVSEDNGCPEPLVWSIALEGKSVKQFLQESPFLLFAPFLNEFLSRIKI